MGVENDQKMSKTEVEKSRRFVKISVGFYRFLVQK
jgi:hypothetical protein